MTDAELVESGTLSKYVAYRKYQFLSFDDYDHEEFGSLYSHAEDELCDVSPDDFTRCEQLYNNNRSRCARLRKKIEKMTCCGHCYFFTFTFRDSVFESTNSQTRRDYVRRFLDYNGFVFCANIDFGGQNGREHYHAIACCENPIRENPSNHNRFILCDLADSWYNSFGFCNIQKVSVNDSSCKALSKYINKLANHSLKDSTQEHRLIYSRKKPSWYKIKK